jgi:hypothetical protein
LEFPWLTLCGMSRAHNHTFEVTQLGDPDRLTPSAHQFCVAGNSSKRKALHDHLLAVAESQGGATIVLFCDEAQRYSLHEYEWLHDVHDELAQSGVRLTTFLFGQERLCEQRARFQESGDTQIVKRFMVETLRFRGVCSALDAATCLRSYDEHEYPLGSRRGRQICLQISTALAPAPVFCRQILPRTQEGNFVYKEHKKVIVLLVALTFRARRKLLRP